MTTPRSRQRTLRPLLVAALVAVGLAVVPGPSASAAPTITGKLYDASSDQAVTGTTVRLRAVTSGGPGAVVDTATTGKGGGFALQAPPGAQYYVQVVAGRVQAGYVGAKPRFAEPSLADAGTFAAGTALGRINANPAFIAGVVIDARTRRPVAGATVSARTYDHPGQVQGSDTTDRMGRFRVTGIRFEDDGLLKVNGAGVGHETGFLGCSFAVVPTPGDACATQIGVLPRKVRLDAASAAARRAPDVRPVAPGRIGQARTGMTIARAFATGEFKKNVPNPPCGTIRLQPTGAWKNRYVVLTGRGKVVEMDVFRKRPRTGAGLGVGSTAGEVFAEYGGQMSDPREWGFGQWATFVREDVGGKRRWLGFLFGQALVEDGPLMNTDRVTLLGVRTGARPGLMLDGC